MSKALHTALADLKGAQAKVERVLKHDYPVGADISWDWRGHRQFGEVIRHGYKDRIQVRNRATLSAVWMHAESVCE